MRTELKTNPGLNVLYLGPEEGTSLHRMLALRRLGLHVRSIDPWKFLPQNGFPKKLLEKFICECGAAPFEPIVRRKLLKLLSGKFFDLVWVSNGELHGADTIRLLRKFAGRIINYSTDDPFGMRDKRRFMLFRQAVPEYDLVVVVREQNVEEAIAAGARRVLRVFMSADEQAHAPFDLTDVERTKWSSEVAFVGTWMPERGPFLARLMELGVPLKIFGGRWEKAREWAVLKKCWASPPIYGADYVKAVQCAKVCLGLLSKGNRDLHTLRSAEVPFIGSVLCGERTPEHEAMYRDNEEAVWWSTPEECAEKAFRVLKDGKLRERIASAGRRRCVRIGLLNEPIVFRVVETAFNGSSGSDNRFRAGMANRGETICPGWQ